MANFEASPPLSKRSCLPCYQRKLKCDKKRPCTRCATRNEKCEYFLGPIRRNRGPKARPDSTADKGLEAQLDGTQSVLAIRDGRANTVTIYKADPSLMKETDLMVIDGTGKSRLLSAVGWASFTDESAESPATIQSVDINETSMDQPGSSPLFMPIFNQEALMNVTPGCSDQRAHVPNPEHLSKYWEVYCRNVDPMVRLVHKPSIEVLLAQVKESSIASCSPASYALLSAICYAAINSLLDVAMVKEVFGQDQKTLSKTLGQTVEQALFKARLSQTHDIVALQAFAILITCTPPDPSRATWTMIGLALRIATSIGLHRDGSELGLSPFESEIRRRLWWHLMMIDVRASEDFSSVPYPYATHRVRVPTNIDDEDMDPNSKVDYVSKEGLTDMSASLIRYAGLQFMLRCISLGQHHCPDCEDRSTSEDPPPCKVVPIKAIEDFEQGIRDKFIKFADQDLSTSKSKLISWMARLGLLKMKVLLGVFHLRKGKSGAHIETEKYADTMFENSVDLLEAQSDLQNSEEFANWFWLLRNYNQWHSMAIILTQVLSEINKMKDPTEAKLPSNMRRAWSIANLTFQQSEAVGIYDKLWGPLSSLRKKVADKLQGPPAERESPPALNFDLSTPDSGMDDVDWTQPLAWTEFDSTPWIDVGSTPWIDFGTAPEPENNGTPSGPSTVGAVNDPWPMYFPTNLFASSGF